MKLIGGPVHGVELRELPHAYYLCSACGLEFVNVLVAQGPDTQRQCYLKVAYFRFWRPLIWYYAWQGDECDAGGDRVLAQALEMFGL